MVKASVGWAHQLGQQGHCREDVASLEETDEEPGEEVDIEGWSGGRDQVGEQHPEQAHHEVPLSSNFVGCPAQES